MKKYLLLLLLGACNTPVKENKTEVTCPPLPAPFTIKHPTWAEQAVLYQVNVRQYTPSGTFRAFEAELPRLDSMGVDILWLMPIQPIGKVKRKGSLGSQYSVREYRGINKEFGTMVDLKHLVEAAHKRKMHVILDWVANHTSWDNALTKTHPDWYTHDAQGNFVPPVPDWQDVIDLNYDKPELRKYMTESMAFWVKEADIDGFRADVAGLVPTDFWENTRAELEKTKPVFMLAEWDELHEPAFVPKGTFSPHTHLLEKAFDATYALRLHYLLDSIAQGRKTTNALQRYFDDERKMYPDGVRLMNFTSSHDVNTWEGSEYKRLGKNAEALAVFAALIPGIPMVYSGQEAAMRKRLRFFDKDTIPWNGYPLRHFYTKLLQLKRHHPALRTYNACGTFRLLPGKEGTITFQRLKGNTQVFVSINLTDDVQSILMPGTVHPFTDAFSSYKHGFSGHRHVNVPAHGWRVLVSE